MSVIATAVRHLMAAGVTGEALFAAIAELEAEVRGEPKVRSSNAIRQERYRRNKALQVTEHNACNGGDGVDKNPPQTPHKNSYTPVTPKGVTAPKGAKRTRGSKIGEDWLPPAVSDLPERAKALASQWTAASYATEAEAFRNYWLGETGAKASKADWRATWCNRIVQIHSKVMRDQKFGNAAPEAPVSAPKDRAAMIEAAEKRVEQFRNLGRQDDAAAAERFLMTLRQTSPPNVAS